MIIRFFCAIAIVFWCILSVWQLLFGMFITGCIGLLALPLWFQPWLPKPFSSVQLLGGGFLVFLLEWNIGIPEYTTKFIEYSCRSKQYFGLDRKESPNWCPSIYRSKLDPFITEPVFKQTEQIAIQMHHIAHMLFYDFLGLSQKSNQGWNMTFFHHSLEDTRDMSLSQRRILCSSTGAQFGMLLRYSNGIYLQSPAFRELLLSKQSEILKEPHSHFWNTELKALSLLETISDKNVESIHMIEFLLDKNAILNTWNFQDRTQFTLDNFVYYFPKQYGQIQLFTLLSRYTIPLDVSMYCGLSMDGQLIPYREKWEWELNHDQWPLLQKQPQTIKHSTREKFAISLLNRYLQKH